MQPVYLRVNLAPFPLPYWDLPRDKVLSLIPESIIGQALQNEPELKILEISHPDVKPAAMEVIANFLEEKEPPKSIPDLASTARYLNIPWLVRYSDPLYDWIIRMTPKTEPYDNSTNRQYLLEASTTGSVYIVEYLLQKGVSPFKTIWSGDVDAMFQPPASDSKQFTCPAFRQAVVSGYVDVVKVLLSQPKIAAIVRMDTALTMAAERYHLDLTRYLLELDSSND
jgi:hypothetical protein